MSVDTWVGRGRIVAIKKPKPSNGYQYIEFLFQVRVTIEYYDMKYLIDEMISVSNVETNIRKLATIDNIEIGDTVEIYLREECGFAIHKFIIKIYYSDSAGLNDKMYSFEQHELDVYKSIDSDLNTELKDQIRFNNFGHEKELPAVDKITRTTEDKYCICNGCTTFYERKRRRIKRVFQI